MVKEEGEVEERVVMNELFAEVSGQVRSLSSAGGLRQMVSFPFSIVKDMTSKIINNKSIIKQNHTEKEE